MLTAFDVANYYLAKASMSPKKLQKIVYYAYGWTLALFNESIHDIHFRLFSNRIEAWVHGPVIPDLYQHYKTYGWQDIPQEDTYSGPKIPSDVADILNQVWDTYGHLTANQLELISHQEYPWINARDGAAAYAATSNQISDEDIFKYFNEQAKAS